MTAEAVSVLPRSCPLLSPTTLTCVGCRLLQPLCVLCSLRVCFSFYSQEQRLQAKNTNIVLVRSGAAIQDGLASVCACGCWQAAAGLLPGAEAEQETSFSPFVKTTPECRGCFYFYK